MIIYFLVDFENDPLNNTIVLQRKKMWHCMNMLKNDKFMKKYIIWQKYIVKYIEEIYDKNI